MAPITNIISKIGNTPLIEITNPSSTRPAARVFGKLELLNPSGSIKDRPALYMVQDAEINGLIGSKKIVEATSGNMGISLAMVAASFGYEFTAIMSERASPERRAIIKQYGGKVELIPASMSYLNAVDRAQQIADETGAWFPNQYANESNARAHEETTGREIVKHLPSVDAFVAGIGTAGTLVGVARAILKVNPNAIIYGVEPTEGALITTGGWQPHGIQGISVGFIPGLYDSNKNIVNEVLTVSTEQAIACAKEIAYTQGLLAGISSGANIFAARMAAERLGKGVVATVLPDSADRYYSTDLFSKD